MKFIMSTRKRFGNGSITWRIGGKRPHGLGSSNESFQIYKFETVDSVPLPCVLSPHSAESTSPHFILGPSSPFHLIRAFTWFFRSPIRVLASSNVYCISVTRFATNFIAFNEGFQTVILDHTPDPRSKSSIQPIVDKMPHQVSPPSDHEQRYHNIPASPKCCSPSARCPRHTLPMGT